MYEAGIVADRPCRSVHSGPGLWNILSSDAALSRARRGSEGSAGSPRTLAFDRDSDGHTDHARADRLNTDP